MITLGLTQGQRGRRAVEVVLGVTLGIAIADLLVILLGTGWWQLAVVVSLTMAVALLLGSGHMFAQQAAVSAALVATLQPPDDGVSFARAVDALIGGGVALAVSALVLPAHPVRLVRRRRRTRPERARRRARRRRRRPLGARPRRRRRPPSSAAAPSTTSPASSTRRSTWAGRPPASRRREDARSARSTTTPRPPRQIELAVRNVRVLARGARRAIDLEENVPPEVSEALRDLAVAVRALGEALDDDAQADAVREPALRAAGKATLVLERTGNLSVTVIVGQVRSTAVDLIRSTGIAYEDAAEAVRARGARRGVLSRGRA